MDLPTPLPQDIVDEIIDNLDNSPQALKSCARVSRSFLNPSRKKLFSVIQLTTETSQRLLPLLQDHSEIADYILDVSFIFLSPDESNAILLDILSLLTCLRGLTIELEAWKSFPKLR